MVIWLTLTVAYGVGKHEGGDDVIEALRRADRKYHDWAVAFVVNSRIVRSRGEESCLPCSTVSRRRTDVIARRGGRLALWSYNERWLASGEIQKSLVSSLYTEHGSYSYSPMTRTGTVAPPGAYDALTPWSVLETASGPLGRATTERRVRSVREDDQNDGQLILVLENRGRAQSSPWARFWLDRSFDWRPIRHEYFDRTGRVVMEISEIDYERRSSHDGDVYLPRAAVVVEYDTQSGVGHTIHDLRVIRWIESTDVDPLFFKPGFPAGMYVRDIGDGTVAQPPREVLTPDLLDARQHFLAEILGPDSDRILRLATDHSMQVARYAIETDNPTGSLPLDWSPVPPIRFLFFVIGTIAPLIGIPARRYIRRRAATLR